MTMPMTRTTAQVLRALAAGCRHGFDKADAAGPRAGTVYRILRRVEVEWRAVEAT